MLGHLPLWSVCANHRQFVLSIITTSLNTWIIMQTEVNPSVFCYIATYKIILSKSINLCLDRHRSAWIVWSLQPYCCFPFMYRQHHTHWQRLGTRTCQDRQVVFLKHVNSPEKLQFHHVSSLPWHIPATVPWLTLLARLVCGQMMNVD